MPRCKKGEHKVSTTNGRSVCKKKKDKRKKKERKAMKARPNEGPARVSGRGRGVRTGQPLTRPGYRSAEGRTVMANGVPTNLINKADHEYQLKQAFDRGMNTVDLTRSSTSSMGRNIKPEPRSKPRKPRRPASTQWYTHAAAGQTIRPPWFGNAGSTPSPSQMFVSPPPPSSPVARRTSRRGAQKPAGTYRVARPYTAIEAAATAQRSEPRQTTQAGMMAAGRSSSAAGTPGQRNSFGAGSVVRSPQHQATIDQAAALLQQPARR